MQRQEREYTSADCVGEEDPQNTFPVDFLNSLTISGLPPHKLFLKIGSPVMLLRNMSAARGLANGTRLIVKRFLEYAVEAEIAEGQHRGQRVFIPRMRLQPSQQDTMPFTLQREQLPLRPAFAMTINKAQGQTLQRAGLYLPSSVFSHGQLYVALSRVGAPDRMRILVKNGQRDDDGCLFTKNVVYRDALIGT